MENLDTATAKIIIETLGSNGIPPEAGVKYYTVGLESYLKIIEKDYLKTFIFNNGSAFKMVVGTYGGGKTHLLYCIRELAWNCNYVVSYVRLSPNESPFHKLEFVYKALAKGLIPPLDPNELLKSPTIGISFLIRSWYSEKYKKLLEHTREKTQITEALLEYINSFDFWENINFYHAIKEAFKSLIHNNDEDFLNILQWLIGESYDRKIHKKYGIFQKIDKTIAFSLIRSMARWIKEIGYSGLVILFDEAEKISSLSSRNKEMLLNNLREIIDECANTNFQNVIIFYAVPDENFLEGKTMIYEALRQRLKTTFNFFNPSGVKIYLDNLEIEPIELLNQIGEKLFEIYKIAYNFKTDDNLVSDAIKEIAQAAYQMRYADIGYKRLFVQKFIQSLNYFKNNGSFPTLEELDFK